MSQLASAVAGVLRAWRWSARAAVAAALAGVASADEVRLSPPGGAAWRPLELPKVERKTDYEVVTRGGAAVLRAVSQCSASALAHPLDRVDLGRTPRLRWRWKIEAALDIPDERSKAGDDFAARIYVMFRFDPARASLWERWRHRLATRRYGELVPGDAINYVWTSGLEAGTRWDNPYTEASKMVSLGRGPLPDWRTEEVDVAADYATLFGRSPPRMLALAVMSDSDNSCGRAVAYFADFAFAAR